MVGPHAGEEVEEGKVAFATTRWSLVVAAGDDAPAALSDLIRIYWYPLYAFVRRGGASAEEAQDWVQGFFAALIEKHFLGKADPERGRFRTFLLTAFKRYVSKEREKAAAQKRGGGRIHLSLDFESGEERYRLEPPDDATPERLFERRWALALLERVLAGLQQDYGRRDQATSFAELKPFLAGGAPAPSKSEAAERLGLTPEAFRVALHRLKRRYRDALMAEILATVEDPADAKDEIRHLMDALAAS